MQFENMVQISIFKLTVIILQNLLFCQPFGIWECYVNTWLFNGYKVGWKKRRFYVGQNLPKARF
jgi:hypothetical protein